MHIKQFRYNQGNLAYLLWSEGEAMAIDGGAVQEILDFLKDNKLQLKLVTNTHGHDDHTVGNRQLLAGTEAAFISASDLMKESGLSLADEFVSVIPAPGHTMDSLVLSSENVLITGDTLFNGTVGNCYSGRYELYFRSLKRLAELPGDRIIYAGHDLVDYATGVIREIDPLNPSLGEYEAGYDPEFVCTTLEEELKVNPFIRFNDAGLDDYRKKLKMPLESEYQRWRAMMTVH